MEKEYILEMLNISKFFPGVKALEGVNLKVREGTVHALLGENGAGKSTLMKILIGLYKCDEGTIKFKGKKVQINKPLDALETGISMIHQELNPIPFMTVAENIFLGREPTYKKSGFVNNKKMVDETGRLLEKLKISISPKVYMHELSIANTQLVEIAKAISYNSELIIMDEPTSAITEQEAEKLFQIIRSLKENGVSVIYISHRMNEIFKISDEITVLRDGKYAGNINVKDATSDKLIQMMVGREIKQIYPKEIAEIGDVLLEVKDFSLKRKFHDINFKVKEGEILGIAGLMGAGRTELMEAVFGITRPDRGELFVKGNKIEIKTPADAIRNKIALLTEDRKLSGMFLPLSVMDNMAMASINKFINKILVNYREVKNKCEQQKDMLSVKTPSLSQSVNNLSGGNQQKVLLARWMLTEPDILILDEPTRGIDVGTKSEIHRIMSNLAQEGKAIIMISSELPEILGMSDRIIVMHEGRITGEISRDEADQDTIMKYATGLVS